MKDHLVNYLKKLLPVKVYRFIRMKPRLIFAPHSLHIKLKRLIRATWNEDFDNRGDDNSFLIKLSHILDKGLQRPDIKPGHSKSILNSINNFISNENHSYEKKHEQWARKLTGIHNSLQNGHYDYQSEFEFKIQHSIPITILNNHVKERRSIRHFSQELITINDVEKAIELLPFAPSSCNRQTSELFITENEEKIQKCLEQNKGATGISGKFIFISLTYDSRSYHLPQEILTGYIDASLAFQNFMLGVHSLGLGATILNWSHASQKEEDNLRRLLSIPVHNQIVCNCIVGRPRYGAPRPSKKDISEFLNIVY